MFKYGGISYIVSEDTYVIQVQRKCSGEIGLRMIAVNIIG
jgi:hypothetical protein